MLRPFSMCLHHHPDHIILIFCVEARLDCAHMFSQGVEEMVIGSSEEDLQEVATWRGWRSWLKPKAEEVLIWIVFINSCVHLDCNDHEALRLLCHNADSYCRMASGSKSSAAGIWGCSRPGHSVDRAPLDRGYSFHAKNVVGKSIWCWDIEKESLRTHTTPLDGTCIWVHKQPCGTVWDARNRPTSIWIHSGVYIRACLFMC